MPTKVFGQDFPAATIPLDGTESLSILQGGVMVDATTQDIADLGGGGGGSGTVTSVNVSGGTTGLATSGGPVTTSGTITLAGTLVAANGGTGQTSYTIGDILYASASGTLSKLAAGTANHVLTSNGAGVAPSWQAAPGGGGSPGGSDTQVQFNDGGAFGGDAGLVYNKTTDTLTTVNLLSTTHTLTGLLLTAASASGSAGLRLPHGAAPSSPTNGDVWTTTTGMFVRVNGATVGPLSAGGGGLTNWTDGANTAAPNATVPVVSFTATNAAAVVDAAIVPKSTGGFALAVADNGTGGGNKRGASSVDLQLVRGSNTQVASGARAFIGAGFNNTASGQAAAVVAGESVNISGQKSFGTGTSNTVSGNNSAAIAGTSANVSGANSIALAGGTASANSSNVSGLGANDNSVTGARARAPFGGSPQEFDAILYGQTTNATPLTLTTNASTAAATNQIYFGNQNNRSGIYRGLVVARQTGNGGGKKSWQFYAHLDRDNNTVALVGAVTPTVVADSGVAWSVAVTADNTLKTLKVEATGAAATTINWACYVDGQEVAGA